MKVLFVTHEGFGNSIFRSQVIEHCESMKELGFDFDVLTYETFKKNRGVSFSNLLNFSKSSNLKVLLKLGFNIYKPFSMILNLFLLINDIKKFQKINPYALIHARADYSALLCSLLKPFHKLPVVWDCRGDSVDELKFALEKFGFLPRVILYLALVPRQVTIRYFARKLSDANICVSEALQSKILSKNEKLNSTVIPCPVPTEKFRYSPEVRLKARRKLNLKINDVLFIYSGSMTGYQSIVEFVWFYEKIISAENTHIIIATVDVDIAIKYLSGIDKNRITITKVAYESMQELYCAADYALMLRKSRDLNFVASPTKFGEYCLAGLTVIHNHSIKQVSDYTRMLGNGLEMDSVQFYKPQVEKRDVISNNSEKLYGRKYLNKYYVDLYSVVFNNKKFIK